METFPQSLGLVWKKLNLTQLIRRNVLQYRINTKKLKPGLVAFFDILPRVSGEAYDINKQTI